MEDIYEMLENAETSFPQLKITRSSKIGLQRPDGYMNALISVDDSTMGFTAGTQNSTSMSSTI